MGEGASERSQGQSALTQVVVGILLTRGVLEPTRSIRIDLK